MPPMMANVANIVKGILVPYSFVAPINGAHRNHARAHTDAENKRVFFLAPSTKSAVHVVKMHNDEEVAIFIATHGIISSATMWYSFTMEGFKVYRYRMNTINNLTKVPYNFPELTKSNRPKLLLPC